MKGTKRFDRYDRVWAANEHCNKAFHKVFSDLSKPDYTNFYQTMWKRPCNSTLNIPCVTITFVKQRATQIKLVIVVTKSAPDLIKPEWRLLVVVHVFAMNLWHAVFVLESLSVILLFSVVFSQLLHFVSWLMKILIHVMLRMDNCFLYIS